MTPGGAITTIAGNGTNGFSGDGGPATSAQLFEARAVAVDSAGNVYIADTGNLRVRRVDTSGIITTVAGGANTSPNEVDGGPPTGVNVGALDVAVDSSGNLYIYGGNRVYKVSGLSGAAQRRRRARHLRQRRRQRRKLPAGSGGQFVGHYPGDESGGPDG